MQLDDCRQILGIEGRSPFSQRDFETGYAIAFGLYERGEYRKAAAFFEHLLLHDPRDLRLWKGLASSKQMAKEYREALRAWATCALLSSHSPAAHFHAAECYLSLGEREEAGKAVALAERFHDKEPGLLSLIAKLKEHL